LRGLLYQFESFEVLALEMEAGGDEQELELQCHDGLKEGEWVLSTFNVGEDSTAVAACVVDRGDGLRLAFTDRDWSRLWQFANSSEPPTIPPPSVPLPAFDIAAPPDATVLIVDDDSDLQNVVCAMLRAAGFNAAAVSSAEEAFDALRAGRPDLMVLDWNLPGMSGVDFCRRLRREPKLSRLPVLFLTAHSSTSDIVEAFQAGADDFVSKPFRAPELAARVFGLIRRAHMPPPSVRSARPGG
jgi:two-component system, OmpR family, phosphate regulon response regulator PhoB